MITEGNLRAEDVVPVHSQCRRTHTREAHTLICNLCSPFGTALGLTIHGRVSDKGLAIRASCRPLGYYLSLFVGGFIASQFTTGENKQATYGSSSGQSNWE